MSGLLNGNHWFAFEPGPLVTTCLHYSAANGKSRAISNIQANVGDDTKYFPTNTAQPPRQSNTRSRYSKWAQEEIAQLNVDRRVFPFCIRVKEKPKVEPLYFKPYYSSLGGRSSRV